MEKSLVREFTPFNSQSNGFLSTNSKSAFIRTFKDQNDLRKSRIQNLPSYKKDDLSKRTDMVVIFQAIEIQRLSVEIQSLRVELKDSERQLQNYLSYQIQIKELNEQCLLFEDQKLHYQSEIEKLNQICQKMYLQLEDMHKKYDHLDINLQNKLQNSLKQNSSLTKQLQDLKKASDKKNSEITQENQKLKNKVTFQQKQIQKLEENLKETKDQVNMKVVDEMVRIKEMENQLKMRQVAMIKEIEDKCKMLNNLKTIVKDKMNQTNREKSKFQNLETNFTNRISQLQNIVKFNDARLKNEILSMNKELEMIENKLKNKEKELFEVKNTYEDRIKQLERVNSAEREKSILAQRQYRDVQQKLRKIQMQADNKKQDLNQKTKQLGELSSKYQSLQAQFSSELNRLSQDKEIISNKIISLLKEVQTKTQQLNSLKNLVIKIKNEHQATLTQKQKVTESFQSTIDQIQVLYQHLDREKTLTYQLRAKNNQLQTLVNRLQNDNKINENQMKGIQTDLTKLNQYKQQLELQLNNLNSQLKSSQKKALEMDKNNQILINKLKSDHKAQLKQLEHQIQSISKSFDLKSKEKSAITQQLLQQRQFSEAQAQAIGQLIKRIEVSEKLLSQVKTQQQKTMAQNSDKMKLTLSKTSEMFKLNEGWVAKIIQMQNQISLLENQNLKLQSENKLLNFEIVETHKIQTMHKRRDSRTSTDSTSLKSFVNLSSMVQQTQQNQRVNSFVKKNKDSTISDISQSEPSQRRIFAQIQNNF